jgi:hypothetical protein
MYYISVSGEKPQSAGTSFAILALRCPLTCIPVTCNGLSAQL